MTPQTTAHRHAGTSAEIYDLTFVPAIAEPVSGRLVEIADLRPGDRVLDLACGTGVIARRAAAAVDPGGAVIGTDVSRDMIDVAQRAARPDGAPITWHVADAASQPIDDDAIDVAMCQMGLMFVDRAATLREVRRVLRPGGRFVLSTPGSIQPLFEILEHGLVEHVNPDLAGFVRAVFSMSDPDEVAGILVASGFDQIEIEQRHAACDLPGPAQFLWDYIDSTPLGAFVGAAPPEARRALEDDVVERWQPFLGDDGHLVLDQPMVDARAVSP